MTARGSGRLIVVAALLCGGLSVKAYGDAPTPAKRQPGQANRVAFDASYTRVFRAASQTVRDLHLTVLGRSQPERYIWAMQRPPLLRSWESIAPMPYALTRNGEPAATPGQHVAIYFYPVSRNRIIVEVIDQRLSPVGVDRLLRADIFDGMKRRLMPKARSRKRAHAPRPARTSIGQATDAPQLPISESVGAPSQHAAP